MLKRNAEAGGLIDDGCAGDGGMKWMFRRECVDRRVETTRRDCAEIIQ